jgi:hypothetical protein
MFKQKSYNFLYFNTKPCVFSFHLKPKLTNGRLKTPLALHHKHTTQHTTKKMMAMVPPACHLPEASIKELSKFVIHHTMDLDHCNTAMFFLYN